MTQDLVQTTRLLALGLTGCLLVGCSSTGAQPPTQTSTDLDAISNCVIPEQEILYGGVETDGIPALTDPEFVSIDEATYLDPEDRVVGIRFDGQWLAIPHNILWYHEIVNLNAGSERVAVTYCPLAGSSIVFDRAGVGGAEFGVTGYLYQTNLIMYDRNDDSSMWAQMDRRGSCGTRVGQALPNRGKL